MKRQAGVTLLGVLIIGALLSIVFLIGMSTVPAYKEFMAVKKVIQAISSTADPSTATISDIRRDFDKRAYIDDITTVTGANLVVGKRNGKVAISVDYERRVPLVANVSLVIAFSAASQ